MATDQPDYIKVAVLDNLIEAQLVESILEEREIPHHIRSFHDTAYNGLFQFQRGWGELSAPAEYAPEIREILQSLKSDSETSIDNE